ncbi:MAG: hypothetical protein LUC83_05960 [Clostridiales bacterium]|nr:hypothetical protein [Clostridiales bacterium]
MDREFMKDFYEKYYEDPVYSAVEEDRVYDRDRRKLIQAEEALMELIGGSGTPAGIKYAECAAQAIRISARIGLDSYLMGAADREKMLR